MHVKEGRLYLERQYWDMREFLSEEIKQSETRMHLRLLLFLLPSLSLQCGISTHTEVGFRWIVYFGKSLFSIHDVSLTQSS